VFFKGKNKNCTRWSVASVGGGHETIEHAVFGERYKADCTATRKKDCSKKRIVKIM